MSFKYRGIVQLVERRSPKPDVVGSSPTAPANFTLFNMAVVAKWLTHQIVALALGGSIPLDRPI